MAEHLPPEESLPQPPDCLWPYCNCERGCEHTVVLRELLESGREYNEAYSRLESATETYGENSNRAPMKEARGRCMAALKRYRAAMTTADAALQSPATKEDEDHG